MSAVLGIHLKLQYFKANSSSFGFFDFVGVLLQLNIQQGQPLSDKQRI